MFHTFAYTRDGDSTVGAELSAIQDNVLTITNDKILPATNLNLQWAGACCISMVSMRLNSPTLRQVSPPYLTEVIDASTPGANDYLVTDYRANPLEFRALEEISVQGTHDNVSDRRSFCILTVTERQTPSPVGQPWAMRGTATTTLVANEWTSVAMTWEDSVPNGTYSVVGLKAQGATAVAARLIFNDQVFRPGAMAVTAINSDIDPIMVKGNQGNWGNFTTTTMPTVQYLSHSADTSQEVILEFVRIR